MDNCQLKFVGIGMLKNKVKLIILIIAAVMAFVGCAGGGDISIPDYSIGSNPLRGNSSENELSGAPNGGRVQTIVFNHDPLNYCTITSNGSEITISGKNADILRSVSSKTLTFNIDTYFSSEELTINLTNLKSISDNRFAEFFILDKNGYKISICFEHTNDGFYFPDVSEIAENNRAVADNVVEASEARVAQFITLDGSRDRIPQILSEIKRISDTICAGIESDYEKLRAISRWVADNIYYDKPAYDDGIPQSCLSLEYMLNNKSSVCGGYSNMTSALCAAQGIRCVNIIGRGVTNGYYVHNLEGVLHEWNVAEIDGKRILIDSTWNSNNHFLTDGTFTANSSEYWYFDVSEEVMALRHKAKTAEYRDYWALS